MSLIRLLGSIPSAFHAASPEISNAPVYRHEQFPSADTALHRVHGPVMPSDGMIARASICPSSPWSYRASSSNHTRSMTESAGKLKFPKSVATSDVVLARSC